VGEEEVVLPDEADDRLLELPDALGVRIPDGPPVQGPGPDLDSVRPGRVALVQRQTGFPWDLSTEKSSPMALLTGASLSPLTPRSPSNAATILTTDSDLCVSRLNAQFGETTCDDLPKPSIT